MITLPGPPRLARLSVASCATCSNESPVRFENCKLFYDDRDYNVFSVISQILPILFPVT